MAINLRFPLLFLLLLSLNPFFFIPSAQSNPLNACNFDQIYNLGDSISDTGNLILESPAGAFSPFARLPYGENFNRTPTGRCSDGKLMIDFIASAAGLPYLNPYKNIDADFRHGANFAVAGSTALPSDILATKNVFNPVTNSSLDVQLDWMFTHFNSICYTNQDCEEKLKKALFMVGEIGGNDYNYGILQGKTIHQLRNMVPDVVRTIQDAIRRVISFGAVRVVVPGNFPIGCLPIYHTIFQNNSSETYDENHCLKELNDFAVYHNKHLKRAIQELRKENPNATIVYGDYYNAFHALLVNALDEGLDVEKACCGGGGNFNFKMSRMCGFPGVSACPNPNQHISWDGIHLTQQAYKFMANWLILHTFNQFHCTT